MDDLSDFSVLELQKKVFLQDPDKISDHHYHLPTQELATDLYIQFLLSFVLLSCRAIYLTFYN